MSEDIIPPKPDEPWLIRVTKSEFKEIAKNNYFITDDQWDEFVEEIDNGYDYGKVFDDLADYLQIYMERQKEECPETHRQCVHFTPMMLDKKYFFSNRKQLIRQGVNGNCYEGGYTEIGNPDEPICAHEDGCNAFKKSEPFTTNDLVMPTSDEVFKSGDHIELLRQMAEEYPHLEYQFRFKEWEEKPEYCELHSVTKIINRKTGVVVGTKRWAFIKSHMTGGISSV